MSKWQSNRGGVQLKGDSVFFNPFSYSGVLLEAAFE